MVKRIEGTLFPLSREEKRMASQLFLIISIYYLIRPAEIHKLHHIFLKFAVIDNKTVITGSFNWSPSAAHTNDETLLVIHSPQLAKHFTREMDRLWDTAELGITPRIQRKLDRKRIRCGDGVERG